MFTIRVVEGMLVLTEIPIQEYRATLDRCAEDLLWEAGVGVPSVDAFDLAERLGIVVTRDRGLAARARYARLRPRTGSRQSIETIAVADEDRPERRHFAVAHEIGEANVYRVFDALGVDPREASAGVRETLANALAGRLLVPSRWLIGLWRDSDGELPELKHRFATASHELIARRVLECVRSPLVVAIVDQGRPAWRRWNLSGAVPPRRRLEIDCLRHAHETGQSAWGEGRDEALSGIGPPIVRVRAWPIHEPGWRREIVITELVGDEPEWF